MRPAESVTPSMNGGTTREEMLSYRVQAVALPGALGCGGSYERVGISRLKELTAKIADTTGCLL